MSEIYLLQRDVSSGEFGTAYEAFFWGSFEEVKAKHEATPPYPKSFQRMAKLSPGGVIEQLPRSAHKEKP